MFVFVEGPTDRYFYDKLCVSQLRAEGIEYNLCLAEELPSNTGGKNALLDFFTYLGKNSLLIDDFKGKRTASVFFIDKDIDDLLGLCKQSQHLVYTEYYQCENYIFAYGNLVDAAAAAAALDPTSVRDGLPDDNDTWRRNAACNWKEWVKLCVFTRMHSLNHECNFGVRVSRIHVSHYGPIITSAYTTALEEIKIRSGLTPNGFKRIFGQISQMVDKLYSEGNHDLIFKGKWYSGFLAEDLARIAGGRPFNSNGLPERILSCLLVTLDFDEPWAGYFKDALDSIVGKLE